MAVIPSEVRFTLGSVVASLSATGGGEKFWAGGKERRAWMGVVTPIHVFQQSDETVRKIQCTGRKNRLTARLPIF